MVIQTLPKSVIQIHVYIRKAHASLISRVMTQRAPGIVRIISRLCYTLLNVDESLIMNYDEMNESLSSSRIIVCNIKLATRVAWKRSLEIHFFGSQLWCERVLCYLLSVDIRCFEFNRTHTYTKVWSKTFLLGPIAGIVWISSMTSVCI